jgi:cell fate (sporulation/competence/biofilm development) regulator YlbF (YheA/YmcA/DUF963 family)
MRTDIYDQAHSLAVSLKQCDEYREYTRLRDIAYQDDTNRALLDEYKRMQYKLQLKMAGGASMEDDGLSRMQQIAALLQFNRDTSAYLLAEFRFQKLLADIYKMLADAAGINLDLLTGV